MRNFSIYKNFIFIFTLSSFVLADQSISNDHTSTTNYVSYSQIGNPADVLEVKTEMSQKLKSGEVRVKVLAAPINPSDLYQISGNYGVDPVLPARPGSEGVGRVTEVSPEAVSYTHLTLPTKRIV